MTQMTERTREITLGLCADTLGSISPGDQERYLEVVNVAYAIHLEKESIRHELWKQYPAGDQVNQCRVKVDRILHSMKRVEADPTGDHDPVVANVLEELADIINYAIFAYRQVSGTD